MQKIVYRKSHFRFSTTNRQIDKCLVLLADYFITSTINIYQEDFSMNTKKRRYNKNIMKKTSALYWFRYLYSQIHNTSISVGLANISLAYEDKYHYPGEIRQLELYNVHSHDARIFISRYVLFIKFFYIAQ